MIESLISFAAHILPTAAIFLLEGFENKKYTAANGPPLTGLTGKLDNPFVHEISFRSKCDTF
jgi:hypothetical protein